MTSHRPVSRSMRLSAIAAAVVALPLVLPAAASAQQQWPSKPIRFIMPFPPGGGTDFVGRIISPELSKSVGQQVIVENRGGAGGSIGVELAAKAEPDGHTMVLGTIGNIAVNPWLYSKMPVDPLRDLAPVSQTSIVLNVLVVHPSLPVKSVQDIIALAKKNPGKLTYGSSGMGAADHLAGELFNRIVGTELVHVPYKGGGPAMADLVGGNITLSFATMVSVIPHWKSGRLRPVAFTLPQRTPLFPDIPTVAEGGAPGFAVTNWYGVFFPAKTARPIIDRMNAAVTAALKVPEIVERHHAAGIVPTTSTPEAFDKFIRGESARFAKLVKEAGIKID